MKKIFKTLAVAAVAILATMSVTSCEDYLDKEPASDVSPELAFKNFTNLQGYIEEIYNCIPNMAQCGWCPSFNFGDDIIQNPQADGEITHQVDIGNFWAWATTSTFWFAQVNSDPTSESAHDHHFYGHAWYCIAKVNKALASIDEYFVGSQEEKNLLLGQLYFFRGWWHFGMMQFFGGIPYIDEVLDATQQQTAVRLSYQECAEKAAADFQMAANLLPVNWDDTATGKATGDNSLRINKVTALAYLGKNYLWAASPLMQHGAQKGGTRTYDYSAELCQKAAKAFGEIIELVQNGACQYKFNQFDYKNVADHTKSSGVDYSYSENWFTSGRSGLQPGGNEAIMRGPSKGWSFSYYRWSRTFCPNEISGGCDNLGHSPTANYVANYGMANGLPLDAEGSGYDPNYPYKDRDPRFYHDIVYDGMEYIKADPSEAHKAMKYAGLATGGSMRKVENASRTGYFLQKFISHLGNQYDGGSYDDAGATPHAYVPYMRLSDIYLMYAEATAATGGRNGKSDNCSLSSVEAINVVRDRVGLGHVDERFTGNAYMDEVRRERAVELAFEGLRFFDLQRWLLLTEPKYTVKTSQEFDRIDGADESFYASNDATDARVANFREEVILKRNFDVKHYWFPLLRDDTYIVEGFEQNPGW